MKKIICLTLALMLPNVTHALSVSCPIYLVKQSSCSGTTTYTTYGSTSNSKSSIATCYTEYNNATGSYIVSGYRKYITSLSCNNGYSAQSHTASSLCIGSSTASPTNITYYTCECADTYSWNNSWTNYSTMYQRDTGTKENCGTSSTVYRYRCKSGYYSAGGKQLAVGSTDGLSCTACPANATCSEGGMTTFTCNIGYYKDGSACTSCETTCGVGHTTDVAGAISSSECKAPANVALTDDTGTFTYSVACCCDGPCSTGTVCKLGETSCSSTADCEFGYTCTDGCCKSKFVITNNCLTDDDCTMIGQYCNTLTHECELRSTIDM